LAGRNESEIVLFHLGGPDSLEPSSVSAELFRDPDIIPIRTFWTAAPPDSEAFLPGDR